MAINPRKGNYLKILLSALLVVALCACGSYIARRRGIIFSLRPRLKVPLILSGTDINNNGIDDSLDIIQGAKEQVDLKPIYKSAYYSGGYPPEGEGVCTDLVWRALSSCGYDLKALIDKDIEENMEFYPRVSGNQDTNIDFRRVPNISSYLKRFAQSVTLDLIPWDEENLRLWQPADIVVFGEDAHIGIISDVRRKDGVPLVLHHGYGHPSHDNALGYYGKDITGHYRLKFIDN